MSRPVVHIVGAGVAGLSAAVTAARAGHEVRLYEASGHAGGRCGAVQGGEHDNGTHVVLGANRAARAFLRTIGAAGDWIEPEPGGLPVVDLASGRVHLVGLAPAAWWRLPPPGFGFAAALRLVRLAALARDRSVADVMGESAFSRAVLEPLTLAALNTPPAEASARRLGMVLRRLMAPGAGRLLVARRGLGPDLVEPALAELAGRGVRPQYRMRLRDLAADRGRVTRLRFGAGAAELGAGDKVILALPAHAVARLLPHLRAPERFEPIVNAHFTTPHDGPVRFVGLLGGVGQWVLFRPGVASVTISAARAEVGWPAETILARVAPEIARAASLLGLPTAGLAPRRVVKERRATPTHPPGRLASIDRRPFANLALAGDWLSPLPATIEAAVASGRAAARAWPGRPARRGLPLPAASSA
jgi:glycine/D-amino acid oxidase-like deaminating enzyme